MLLAPLIRRLELFAPLGEEDRRALASLPVQSYTLEAHENLALQGERSDGITVLLRGFALRYKLLPDGRRQIVSFCLPGDICDLRQNAGDVIDHSIAAATSLRVASFAADEFMALVDASPRLMRALLWLVLIQESVTREWVVNVGHRSAYERMAHLFCEVYLRLHSLELAVDGRCELPLRQSELADTLALSAVHVNRTLMEMRRNGLVTFQNRLLVIHDLPALKLAASFDAQYLHLGPTAPRQGALPGRVAS